MSKHIVFIHGMFQNPKSWMKWISYFSARGYQCQAPAWPYHEGEPAALRANPSPELGELHLQTVIDMYAGIISALPEKPIVIGHSVGGLIAQVLVSKQLAAAGICVSSVAPNKMLAFDWGFFRNSVTIANPLKGNDPFMMDADGFHQNFANTLSKEESDKAFETYATHDSRNMLRDCMMQPGEIDVKRPHVPLLFIAAEKDEIIPPELNVKNVKAYTDEHSITDIKEFPNRGHFICGEPGWDEIAAYCEQWLDRNGLKPADDSTATTQKMAAR